MYAHVSAHTRAHTPMYVCEWAFQSFECVCVRLCHKHACGTIVTLYTNTDKYAAGKLDTSTQYQCLVSICLSLPLWQCMRAKLKPSHISIVRVKVLFQ